MPDLSACYFCGTALDEPLSEYPVVPMTLTPTPEEQKTVVLCSACRRKLGRVLDTVLDAVEDRPIDATVQQDLAAASEDVSTDDDSANAESDGDDGEEVEDDESADVVWATADEADDETGESADVAVDAGRDDIQDERDDDVAEAVDDTVEVEEPTEADDADTTEDVDETEAKENQRVDTETVETDTAEPADPPTATDGNGEDEDGPHLSALEYTKVMRLLENRDLPVDRDEFRVVATNAYEITAEEFDTVVDAAIDRGLIVEEDGKFVDVE